MMIAAAKKMPRLTSWLPCRIAEKRLAWLAWCSRPDWIACQRSTRWRKTFSTMMTLASTTSPKSSAPTDSRFADSPCTVRISTANDNAKGMVSATITAERRLPRNSHWRTKISAMPSIRLCITVCVVTSIRSERS